MTYINARDPSTSLGAAPAVPLALPGGCYCGAVRYVLRLASADEARTHICHCSACRKMHGGVFGVTARVAVQALRYEQGKDDLTVHQSQPLDGLGSGSHSYREFCAKCGSLLCVYGEHSKSLFRTLTLGTLDDCSALEPRAEYFCSQRVPWMPAVPGKAQFAKQ